MKVRNAARALHADGVTKYAPSVIPLAATFWILVARLGAAWSDPVPTGKIQPNQQFVDLANGRIRGATIKMRCFDPFHPGQQGRPLSGQWAKVVRSEVIAQFGYTGSLGSIVADCPGAGTTLQQITFSSYGVKGAISAPFLLPCGGSAAVVFHLKPTGPTAKSFTVSVDFMGQP